MTDARRRFFPGQALASLIRGSTAELSVGRALLTATVDAAGAAAVARVFLTRRDISG